jgi:hypothetical protein
MQNEAELRALRNACLQTAAHNKQVLTVAHLSMS